MSVSFPYVRLCLRRAMRLAPDPGYGKGALRVNYQRLRAGGRDMAESDPEGKRGALAAPRQRGSGSQVQANCPCRKPSAGRGRHRRGRSARRIGMTL